MPAIGDHFESVQKLTAAQISEFATSVGDTNPIHHDPDVAARSRFGRVIASGPQLCSLMLAVSGARLSRDRSMLGLSFDVEFKDAVKSDEEFILRWQVVDEKPTSTGTLVVVRITIHVGNRLCVLATNRALVFD